MMPINDADQWGFDAEICAVQIGKIVWVGELKWSLVFGITEIICAHPVDLERHGFSIAPKRGWIRRSPDQRPGIQTLHSHTEW